MRSFTPSHRVLAAGPEFSKIKILFCSLLCAIAFLPGCGKNEPAPAPPAKSDASTAPADLTPSPAAPAAPVTLDPATTFAQSCARCHGPDGSFYALPFKHQGEELRNTIRIMMIGNAQLNPTEADVDAMLQYHLKMRERLTKKNPNDQ